MTNRPWAAARIALALGGLAVPTLCWAGGATDYGIPTKGASIEAFAPKGWTVRDRLQADFNGDGLADNVLVLTNTEKEEADQGEETVPRLLVVLFGQPDGSFVLSAFSEKALLCGHCGGLMGDPYDKMSVAKGGFSVDHYGGSSDRWGFHHQYRYQDGAWVLIGHKVTTMNVLHAEDGDVTDINLLTGKQVQRTTKDGRTRETVTQLPKKPPPRLEEVDAEAD